VAFLSTSHRSVRLRLCRMFWPLKAGWTRAAMNTGVCPPNGNDANYPLSFPSPLLPFLSPPFPSPALSFPPFPYLPSPPQGLGAESPVAGVRGCHPEKMEWSLPSPGSGGRAPSGGGSGVSPRKKMEIENSISCILAHFCFTTADIQCFTFCEQNWHNDVGV